MSDKLKFKVVSDEPITVGDLFHREFHVTEKLVDGKLITYIERREPVDYDALNDPIFEIT